MTPTTEQTDRMNEFLFKCLLAKVNGLPSPAVPPTIREDVKRGVDFSEIFRKCGPGVAPPEASLGGIQDSVYLSWRRFSLPLAA
jgi:hypothetical protein